MIKTFDMRIFKRNTPDKASHKRRELLAPDEMMNLLLSHYLKLDEAGKERMEKRFKGEDSHLYPMEEESFDEMLEQNFQDWKIKFKQDMPGILKKIDDNDYLNWELATPWWKQLFVVVGLMNRCGDCED